MEQSPTPSRDSTPRDPPTLRRSDGPPLQLEDHSELQRHLAAPCFYTDAAGPTIVNMLYVIVAIIITEFDSYSYSKSTFHKSKNDLTCTCVYHLYC